MMGSVAVLPYQVGVALVFGVDGDGGVAEHRFGAGCGDGKLVGAVGQRIANVVHTGFFVGVLDFEIGQRGSASGAPVGDARAFVD